MKRMPLALNVIQKKVLCSAENSSVIWAEPHIRSLAKPNILSVNTMACGCQFSCPLGMGAIWNEKNLEWLWSTLTFTHLENFLEFSRQLAGALSPALVHSAHLQQLQAHLIRSASTSPFLSPQNSLQAATLLHSSAAAAAAVSAAASLHATSTNPYFPLTINPGCDTKSGSEAQFQSRFDPVSESRKQLETCSNVVSSTMEDEDSSSREGLTPLTTVKVRISYVFCSWFSDYKLCRELCNSFFDRFLLV